MIASLPNKCLPDDNLPWSGRFAPIPPLGRLGWPYLKSTQKNADVPKCWQGSKNTVHQSSMFFNIWFAVCYLSRSCPESLYRQHRENWGLNFRVKERRMVVDILYMGA
jgi:hypothetical protein